MMLGLLTKIVQLSRLRRTKRLDLDAWRLSQLNGLIKHARQEVPLYKEHYAHLRQDFTLESIEDLNTLPIITKDVLKRNFPDRTTAQRLNHSDLYNISTSGTTDRIMLFHDESKRDWDRAADITLLFEMERKGRGHRELTIPADACYERCGIGDRGKGNLSDVIKDAISGMLSFNQQKFRDALRETRSYLATRYLWSNRLIKGPGVDGTAVDQEKIDYYYDEIKEWQASVVIGLPFYLYILAKRKPENTAVDTVRMLRPHGGKASAHMIRTIEKAFNSRFRENYGSSELGTMSFDCPYSRHQHLLDPLFIIEFMRNGLPVQPGELGEIFITDLHNLASPLIRYAVGDIGRYWNYECECGSDSLMFDVVGRSDEVVVMPNKGAYTSDELIDFFLEQPEIEFAKLYERSVGKFLLEFVPGVGTLDHEKIGREFQKFVRSPIKLHIRTVRRIAPEGSGKYKLVVSQSYSSFHSSPEKIYAVH